MTANGKIVAVRVQDGYDGAWYNWNGTSSGSGSWDKTPTAHSGYNLYVAVAVKSSLAGKVTIMVSLAGDPLYFRVANVSIAQQGYAGIECNWTMPNNNANISVSVMDVG